MQQAVKAKFAIDMPIRTVGEYLRRWGFTPQRPAKRALQQCPAQVQQWLQVDYPAIVKRAKAEQALVHWADETAVRQDTAWARGYAAAGHTPVVEHAAKRPSPGLTMISALSNQGLLRFGLHDSTINTERFIDFTADLMHDAACKVFLIVDNLPVHRADKVRHWLHDKSDRIKLFYLPPYSPQMNPDEWVNRDLKTELRTRPATSDRDTLKGIARCFHGNLEPQAASPHELLVASRTIIRTLGKELRMGIVPILHGLNRRLALQGGLRQSMVVQGHVTHQRLLHVQRRVEAVGP